ncbi:MAG: flippase-like domain-containing protein [Aquificae bacterium]|nr:flippase-like domain-containing protein [Aquificota bacterium]
MPPVALFWGSLATLLFVIVSFFFLVAKFAPQTDWSWTGRLDAKYLLLALFLLFLYHSFDMLRLKTIAGGYNIRYSYAYAYAMSFIATFGATITPAHLGGELILYYLLSRLGVSRRKIWGTILFKTVSGFSFFLVALPVLVLYTFSDEEILKKVFILFIIFALFSLVSVPVFRWFKNFEGNGRLKKTVKVYCYTLLHFWRKKRTLFLKACLYSILLYLVFLSFAPVLLKAFGVEFDWLEVYLLQLPLMYAIFTSPSPGGSGVGELGSAAIFEGVVPASVLGPFVILWRFLSQYLSAFVGGILFAAIVYGDWRRSERR